MLDVLAVGRDRTDLLALNEMLRQHEGVVVRQRLLNGSSIDPLGGEESLPDLLVLTLGSDSTDELKALDQRPVDERPSVLVIGPEGNLGLMRLAMRAGARDFFFNPPNQQELLLAIDRAIAEKSQASASKRQVTVTVNAKGGSGASFVATNLAHFIATRLKSKVALLDADLQFGFLASNFDIAPNDGLQHAMESVDTLDGVALEGWAAKHQSGVHLFGSTHRELLLARDFSEDHVGKLLNLLVRTYSHTVVDTPRQIDHLFATFVNRADSVVLVLQQSVAHLRDARTMMSILQRELVLREDQIVVLVNRWTKNAVVSLTDIEKALRTPRIFTLPNDYQIVTQSLNLGTPLLESNPKARITRDFGVLAEAVADIRPIERGFFHRLFASKG